jgi:hypothetical protein
MPHRDYSLLGPDARRAVENGRGGAEWYRTDFPRKEMKALMQRSDAPAIRRQLRHEDHFIRRDLPPTAKTNREDFHAGALGVPAE